MPLYYSRRCLIEFEISGIGVWSESFSNWDEFCSGLGSGAWPTSSALQPHLIPPTERRRAPRFVKMAIEVMYQACTMAGMEPEKPSTVFCSQMADMDITDYMCRQLSQSANLISPTKFHNSVNNASVGYWSIATGSRAPANAISAFDLGPSMTLLEATTLMAMEQTPVLAVIQDGNPPQPLHYICPTSHSFAAALLIVPPGVCQRPMASCQLTTLHAQADWPGVSPELPVDLLMNPSARIVPLLVALARSSQVPVDLTFPLSSQTSLQLNIQRRPY